MIPYKTNEDKDKPNMSQMRLNRTVIKIDRANISWVICRVHSTQESIYLWFIYIYIYILEYTNTDYCNLVNKQQPVYCVAAKTDRNGRMIKEIRDCKTKLPALCSGSEVADVNTKQSSIHGEFSSVWSRLC